MLNFCYSSFTKLSFEIGVFEHVCGLPLSEGMDVHPNDMFVNAKVGCPGPLTGV
jgi:hypothetical protein